MKIGVCGIACEKCPRMQKHICPNGEEGCVAKESPFCKIKTCAYQKGINLCFDCPEFPCEITKDGPIAYGYCQYMAGE